MLIDLDGHIKIIKGKVIVQSQINTTEVDFDGNIISSVSLEESISQASINNTTYSPSILNSAPLVSAENSCIVCYDKQDDSGVWYEKCYPRGCKH